MQSKRWWQSRLIWLGMASGLLAFLGTIDPSVVSDNPRVVMLVAAGVSGLTVALRIWTSTSIE